MRYRRHVATALREYRELRIETFEHWHRLCDLGSRRESMTPGSFNAEQKRILERLAFTGRELRRRAAFLDAYEHRFGWVSYDQLVTEPGKESVH
jgi:hypothetical protein